MKAYWIAHVDVSDAQAYSQYTSRAPAAFIKYGGRFLARGGKSEALEGRDTPQRSVVIEFESYDQAVACYHSPEYQAAKVHLDQVGEIDLVICPGYAG